MLGGELAAPGAGRGGKVVFYFLPDLGFEIPVAQMMAGKDVYWGGRKVRLETARSLLSPCSDLDGSGFSVLLFTSSLLTFLFLACGRNLIFSQSKTSARETEASVCTPRLPGQRQAGYPRCLCGTLCPSFPAAWLSLFGVTQKFIAEVF